MQNFIEENGILKADCIVKNTGNRYTLISRKGGVLYDSNKSGEEYKLDNHFYRAEIKDAEAGREGFAVRRSITTGIETAYFSLPIKDGIIVRSARNYSEIKEQLSGNVKRNLLFFILLDIVLVFSYRKFLIGILRKRMKEMQVILEHGEKAKEIYLEDDDELRYFWRVIKSWQNRNIKNLQKLEGEMGKLREVISSVDMGIIVLNEDGEIVLNNEFSEIVIDSEISGSKYFEKITHIELIKFINRLFESGSATKEELYVSDVKKYCIIEGKFIENIRFYIITLKNITKEKEINEIQRRFITNISHEIKTPLTNIKGYMVAVKDEKDDELRGNFINIINRNVEKIENMVRDFLNMSKVESSKIVNRYPCLARKIFDSVEQNLENMINKKGAEIEYSVKTKENDGYINVDFDKVYIVLRNLVENAIIYCSKTPKININVVEQEKEYLFSVEDNGIGIPAGETEKIFERFYRVDKARNTNIAGTGLGLAIVDEVLKIYGGKIEVESEEGKGTKFSFRISKN